MSVGGHELSGGEDQSEGGLGTVRAFGPFWDGVVGVVAITFAIFHLWTALFGALQGSQQPVVHLAFALVLVFLLRPFSARGPWKRPSIVDFLWIAGTLAASGYLVWEDDTLPSRLGLVFTEDVVLGCIMVVAVLESSRRLMGWALSGFAIASILYAWAGPYLPRLISHQGFAIDQMTSVLYLTTEGIYGDALQVSASFIVLFTILGALMHESGAGQFFTNLAYGLFGRVRGGPAKVTVAGSCLFGMISGSAVANVAAVGTFTIPLMKRTGFDPKFAAAVEAVGSTGGQFMPPIMASAAFIIAEILGIRYIEVAMGAAIPALLYYLSLFVTVDLHAARTGLRGLPASELPDIRAVLRRSGHLLLIPAALVWFMAVSGYSPGKAAVLSITAAVWLFLLQETLSRPRGDWPALIGVVLLIHGVVLLIARTVEREAGAAAGLAILLLLFVALRLAPGTRLDALGVMLGRLGRALRAGAIGTLEVALSCACAGIVIGMLMLTGLGLRLSGVLIDMAGSNLLILAIYTMIASLILGLGLPTVAAYVVLAVLVAPAMTKLGVPPLAAHLFVFYFGIISAITPPVALASYTAAAIAGCDPLKASWLSMRLGYSAYVVPFFMIYNPELLMQGSWLAVATVALTAVAGVSAVAAAFEGYWLTHLRWWERALMTVGGLLLVDTHWQSLAAGAVLTAVALLTQLQASRGRKAAAQAT